VFWSTLARLIVVPLSFVLAAAAALFVLVTLGLERITQAAKQGASGDLGHLEVLFDLVWQGGLLASGATILPALAVVVIGEVARIRSSVYYIVGGGLALAVIPLLARSGALPPAMVWQVFATAGFVGGWIYWLLAGRRA
jgi:hypothetical protein